MGKRHKETKKDIVEMKVGCRFYEGAVNVPDVRFSVGSMLEAVYTLVCGFPKAKQLDPPLSHRHTRLTHHYSEGGRARVFLFMWKKGERRGGKNEWR